MMLSSKAQCLFSKELLMFDRESLTASMLQISSLKECYVVVLKKDSMKDTFSTRRTVLNF